MTTIAAPRPALRPAPTPAPVVVTFGRLEYVHVALGGALRQVENILLSRADAHGYEGDGWTPHLVGALGEAALAKHLGIYWSVGVVRAPDVGGYQVRATTRADGCLIVHDGDDADAPYILAVVAPRRFAVRLVGWLRGREAQQGRYWRETTGRPAYFVPQGALRDIKELR